MLEQEEPKNNRETLEKILFHLEANSINANALDPFLVSDIVNYLSSTERINHFELDKMFFEKGIISQNDYDSYMSAAYIMAVAISAPNPENFLVVVPVETMIYNIKCEMKAALAKDESYTIHGRCIQSMSKLKSCFKSPELHKKYDYDSMLKSVKMELGLIKPKSQKKKKEKKKNKPNEKKEAPQQPRKTEKELNPEWCFTEPPKKNYKPSDEPRKKRSQKLNPVFDPIMVEKRIKSKITAGDSIDNIVDYVTKQTGTDYETSVLYLNELVYNTVKTALWTNKSASKNTINYISKNKQVKIAEEYVSRNAVSETIGIQRITASKNLLLKHLALDEDAIDEIISAKLQKYSEISERIDAAYPSHAPLEERIAFEEKPVFVTKHIKQRALQRMGEGANKSKFLTEMFYNGRTIRVYYDVNPHRIFEFSGELFEVPYVDTGEDYVLLTVFPRKNY